MAKSAQVKLRRFHLDEGRMETSGQLFDDLPRGEGEVFTSLLARPGVRIERIVSTGQASPEGFWYDQAWGEWVLLLTGEAGLHLEGEPAPRTLKPGSWLHLPPNHRHRVAWTQSDPPTVWLAVHYWEETSLD